MGLADLATGAPLVGVFSLAAAAALESLAAAPLVSAFCGASFFGGASFLGSSFYLGRRGAASFLGAGAGDLEAL